jgi:8-oxo-dGTP diphosphatase
MSFTSEKQEIAITVDIIVYSIKKGGILLIKRKNEPFRGLFALPGGFLDVQSGESLTEAASRELEEETGLKIHADDIVQLEAVYSKERDPRGPTLTVVHTALLESSPHCGEVNPGDDATEAVWFSVDEITSMELAFDHGKIIEDNIDVAIEEIGII